MKRIGKLQAAKKEIKKIIKDFRQNAKPKKQVWYSYSKKLFDIPITLVTSGMSKENWTPEQIERMENNKPIKTKREIIREFKSTKFYKLLNEGKI